ncbi:MAG: ferredoxin [Acidobacteriota bacterium]
MSVLDWGMARYQRHVFVCVNERPADHPRGCCAARGSERVREAFKQGLRKRGLAGRMRANRSGCLDSCEEGVCVVIYPEGVWYGGVTETDVEEIIQEHLLGGKVVTRLLQKGGEGLTEIHPDDPGTAPEGAAAKPGD